MKSHKDSPDLFLEWKAFSVSPDESRTSKPGTCYLSHMEPIFRSHLHTTLLSMHLVQRDPSGVLFLIYPMSWGELWLLWVCWWWLFLLYPCFFIHILNVKGTSMQLVNIRIYCKAEGWKQISPWLCSCSAHIHLERCCKEPLIRQS